MSSKKQKHNRRRNKRAHSSPVNKSNFIKEKFYLYPDLPGDVPFVIGYETMKKLGHFKNVNKDKQNSKHYHKSSHELDGNEKFSKNKLFKYSNYEQTIKHDKKSRKTKREPLYRFDHCIGLKKLDFIKNEEDKMYYFEVRVDRIPTDAAFIGISSSNINNKSPYRRIPVIISWGMLCGQLSHPQFPVATCNPPTIGETMGILIDFKTKKWNGCIRIFKNKQEIQSDKEHDQPFIHNLLSKEYIWGKIPPISLFIGKYYKAKFKFTIKQFPSIPVRYRYLFKMFYTQKLRITNTIKLMQQTGCNDIMWLILETFLSILPKLEQMINNKFTFGYNWRTYTEICQFAVDILTKLINTEFGMVIIDEEVINLSECENKSTQPLIEEMCSEIFHLMATRSQREDFYVMFKIMSIYVSIREIVRMQRFVIIMITCFRKKEYQIGIKILDELLKRDKTDNYEINKMELLELRDESMNDWSNMLCANCEGNNNLKSCKGCMKIVYCSRKCQKVHWRYKHRVHCDRMWNNSALYQIFCNNLD